MWVAMPERPQLVIQLRVDGIVEAETRNIYGDACVPFAPILEDLCDAEAIQSDYTEEYYVAMQREEQIAEVEDHDHR
jgi:hypothetical protein